MAALPSSSSASSTSVQVLPRITIQDSFTTVLGEIKAGLHAVEDAWVSVYWDGKESVHGKVRISETEPGEVELTARDGVQVELVAERELKVACEKLGVPPTTTLFPLDTPFQLRGGIDCFDISPDGKRFVVAGKDGLVRVGEFSTGKTVELKGHVGDMRDVRFFPSSEVVITSSSDMSVRIFSALDGSNPRTLLSHTRAVTSISILGIGRTILSASLDGSLKRWNVGESTILETIRFTQPIHALAVGRSPESEGPETEQANGVGLIALAAHSNGSVSVVKLGEGDGQKIRELKGGKSSLDVIDYDEAKGLVVVGSRTGSISIFDLRLSPPPSLLPGESEPSADLPVLSFKRSGAPITSVSFCSSLGGTTSVLVGTADGLPCRISWREDKVLRVEEEFAGLDCDAAVMKERRGAVWVAAADGKLRRYRGVGRD